jgi:hypothetical protein
VPALGDPGRLPPLSRRSSHERVASLGARSLVSPKPRPGRTRADQAPLTDFCNRREGRAHPGAARYPARQRVARRRLVIEDHGRQAPVTRLGVELPPCRSPRPDQASSRKREACSNRKRAPLSGNDSASTPGGECRQPVPQGSPSTCRANGEAVERARVPSPRSEPRLSLRPFAGSIGAERRRPFFTHTSA